MAGSDYVNIVIK